MPLVTIAVRPRAEKEHQMYPKRMVLRILGLTLLVTLIGLALSACGGGQEDAQARTIRENQAGKLRAGEYVSDEFEPAVSFRLGEGWQVGPQAGEWRETQINLSLTGAPLRSLLA
jgi:hypothetical protein